MADTQDRHQGNAAPDSPPAELTSPLLKISKFLVGLPGQMTIEPNENQLLEQCPFCGYSLEGLPTKHRCPECGMRFDRRWRMYGGQPWEKRSRYITLILIAIFAAVQLYVYRSIILEAAFLTRMACFVLAPTVVILLAWRYGHPRRFVLVGPTGIAICNRGKTRFDWYPWARIGRACVQPMGNSIIIEIDRKCRNLLGIGMFLDKQQPSRCVEDINTCERLDENDGSM